jgi:hypothetical protein
VLYSNKDKSHIARSFTYNTIREVASTLSLPPSVVSNTYHKLIHPRGVMLFTDLFKVEAVSPSAGQSESRAPAQFGGIPRVRSGLSVGQLRCRVGRAGR